MRRRCRIRSRAIKATYLLIKRLGQSRKMRAPKLPQVNRWPTPETYLWNTTQTSPADGSSTKGFVEEQSGQPPGLKITRHTDWEANPVEDNTLTYSAPGSSVKFTVREANSAGFAGSAFTPGFGMQGDENSGAFGLTPVPWGATAMARSQKVDWTLVNLKNFGVTAFGYQNEVGSNFKPFGQTKNEFGTAGSSTMKAGGAVRVGPFGFGFAQSSREQLAWSGFQGVETGANLAAVQQEASVTLDLANLAGHGRERLLYETPSDTLGIRQHWAYSQPRSSSERHRQHQFRWHLGMGYGPNEFGLLELRLL